MPFSGSFRNVGARMCGVCIIIQLLYIIHIINVCTKSNHFCSCITSKYNSCRFCARLGVCVCVWLLRLCAAPKIVSRHGRVPHAHTYNDCTAMKNGVDDSRQLAARCVAKRDFRAVRFIGKGVAIENSGSGSKVLHFARNLDSLVDFHPLEWCAWASAGERTRTRSFSFANLAMSDVHRRRRRRRRRHTGARSKLKIISLHILFPPVPFFVGHRYVDVHTQASVQCKAPR